MAEGPQGWIDLKPAIRDDFSSAPGNFIRADDPLPWSLVVIRILGFAALLGFPLVSSILIHTLNHTAHPTSSQVYGLSLIGPGMVLVAFIVLGATIRAAGGALRGALAGAALYLLIGAAFGAHMFLLLGPPADLILIGYFGAAWPVQAPIVLGFFGVG